jgi:putative sterol carrier protein
VAPVAARAFFDGLAARASAAKLAGLEHTYRFEIDGEGVWSVRVHDGAVAVSEGGEDGRADATIRTSGEVFDRIVAGKQNAATAYMTGKVKVEGDLGAVMKLQRLFA